MLTSLGKHELCRIILDVTRKCYPGSCGNSRKYMRIHPRCKMRDDSPALLAEQYMFCIKHVRGLYMLDGLQRDTKNTITSLVGH